MLYSFNIETIFLLIRIKMLRNLKYPDFPFPEIIILLAFSNTHHTQAGPKCRNESARMKFYNSPEILPVRQNDDSAKKWKK